MYNALYMSINPNSVQKIEKKIKNYEFRNYIPKRKFNKIYVYVTSPVCELKYIIMICDIIEVPDTILENGDGNHEFNNGVKSKYAYQISKVYKLQNSIKLIELRTRYGFVPPQGFAYDDRYSELSELLESMGKELIWKK